MKKTILLTGATDGIGFETAKRLAEGGHHLLIHGRSEEKLARVKAELARINDAAAIETYRADLSDLNEVEALAAAVSEQHTSLDVLINNAGVFKVRDSIASNGLDVRIVVNVLAPYILTRRFLPLMPPQGRVVNLSSAAQAPVNLEALGGNVPLDDNQAYAQSKLAITMWSRHMADELGDSGPAIIAVNPASFLASKMVKEAYGVAGNDLTVGADILVRAALSDEFESATGLYFDNDQRRFASPHADALNDSKNERLVAKIEAVLSVLNG